jgi:cytoskeleton protein RodZ
MAQPAALASPRTDETDVSDELLFSAETIGAAIRQRRQQRKMTLDQLSLATRIKPQFIQALEEMRLEDLPSRAFVVGYVRACAEALGFDAQAAVERFKQEVPEQGAVLATPVSGEQHERADPRFRLLVILGILVVAAIIAWNIAERVRSHAPPLRRSAAPPALSAPASTSTPIGPVSLGAPLPPPAEASNPEPYRTPGLDLGSSAPPPQVASAMPPAGALFQPKANVKVYGSPTAHIILQAIKPASLVIKGPDGKVYFARQLEAGEAYAAPALEGLTFEVSNPAVVGLYIDRVLRGPLPAATGALSSLGATAAPAAQP